MSINPSMLVSAFLFTCIALIHVRLFHIFNGSTAFAFLKHHACQNQLMSQSIDLTLL